MAEIPARRRRLGLATIAGIATLTGIGLGLRRRSGTRRQSEIPLPRGRALITGASSGIGAEFARQLAAAGFDLVLVARRADRLESLVAELTDKHRIRAEALPADLADEDGIASVCRHIENSEDLVLLVNNAGFGVSGTFAEAPADRLLDMVRVHVLAAVALSRAALPGMIRGNQGAIINVSSVAAFFASSGSVTYGSTKAYLNVFSEALAAEIAGTGVRVQALCPGFTYSEFHDTPDLAGFERDAIPTAMWLTAEEVVAESLRALSDGQVIVIPGRRYQGLVMTARSPLGGPMRRAARAVRRRWAKYG